MGSFRIGIGGISTESSTFTRHRTIAEDFDVLRGSEVIDLYRFGERFGTLGEIEWVPVLRAAAPPGGPVDDATYASLEKELLSDLEEAVTPAPLDGLYLDLHGAMTVVGRKSIEEGLLERIRAIVGRATVISVSMDPHGNLSREFVQLIDLATSHRHSPHIDNADTRDRAMSLLLDSLRKGERPAKAWVRIPVLLSGERTSTLAEPGRRMCIDNVARALASFDVEDAAVWVGRAWADEARCAAGVLALAYDPDVARACAEELASAYWGQREDFTLVVENHGTWDEGLDFVLAGAPAPVLLSDSGDNVTAGGSGDITFALQATAARHDIAASGLSFLFAGIVDPVAVESAAAAGTGAIAAIPIGATVDARFGDPFEREWAIEKIVESEDQRPVGALLRSDSLSVLVQTGRSPFVHPDDPAFAPGMLQDVAYIDPADYDVVVVKNGYVFPSQERVTASSFLAITPGGTDLDFSRLPYERRLRPMFPLDADFEPDLGATVMIP